MVEVFRSVILMVCLALEWLAMHGLKVKEEVLNTQSVRCIIGGGGGAVGLF